MNGYRAVIALVLLCALALCAFAAPSAVAAKGTTAFTCVKGGGAGDFSDPDCAKGVKAGTGNYGHVEIEDQLDTEVSLSTVESAGVPKFEFVIEKIQGEIFCLGAASGLTEMTNEGSTPMEVKTSEVVITFEGCVPIGVLAFEECVVTNERITFQGITGKTVKDTMEMEFKPVGSSLAFFKLEKCSNAKLNAFIKVEGSMRAVYEGAYLHFSPETTKGLKVLGEPASLSASLTVQKTKGGNPVSFTTTN